MLKCVRFFIKFVINYYGVRCHQIMRIYVSSHKFTCIFNLCLPHLHSIYHFIVLIILDAIIKILSLDEHNKKEVYLQY